MVSDKPGAIHTTLVVPPQLDEKALEILNAERDASGATNVWQDTAELIVSPYLGA